MAVTVAPLHSPPDDTDTDISVCGTHTDITLANMLGDEAWDPLFYVSSYKTNHFQGVILSVIRHSIKEGLMSGI